MPATNNIASKLNPFQKQRDLSERFDMSSPNPKLGSIYTKDANREPAPIISLSVGSAGMHRTALWTKKMNALGCLGRIQSLIVYDCNSTNIRLWRKAAQNSGLDHLSIIPEYLPLSEGFLRQPDFFEDHYGAIERDIERIVDDVERRANEAGTRPQVILEWVGFGGHARLSYLIHEHMQDRFPKAQFLPIYCMPAERVLEQNIREHNLWNQAESIIGEIPSLITDNRAAGSLQVLDERVALGLAAMEACYRFRPESGTMAETISMFGMHQSRWLSLDMIDIPYRANRPQRRRQHGRQLRPSHEQRTSQSAVVQSIKEAIWRIAEPANDEQHTAYFKTPPNDTEQKIYVILPFDHVVVDEIKNDVEDQLQRETFTGPFPGTKIAFASGNALWRYDEDGFDYGHVCKIAGMDKELIPTSIERIIQDDGNFRNNRRRVLSKGEKKMVNMGIPLSDRYENKGAGEALSLDKNSSIIQTNGHSNQLDDTYQPDEKRFAHNDLGQGEGQLVGQEEEITPV